MLAFALALSIAQDKPLEVWAAPVPRLFASANGQFALRVTPKNAGADAEGVLTELDSTGESRERWRKIMVCLPVEVAVSDRGHVATFDVWGRKGGDHSLVLYATDGKVVADLELGKIFRQIPSKNNPYFLKVEKSTHWTLTTEYGFNPKWLPLIDRPETPSRVVFALRAAWNERVLFDPDSGKKIERKAS